MASFRFSSLVFLLGISWPFTEAYGTTPKGRRAFLATSTLSLGGVLSSGSAPAQAAFTPGGTLVDREVGPTVGNSEASASRAVDNTNVLFIQDFYFKFGNAAPWIDESNRDEFPTTMPFTRSQQRYDAIGKYGQRITAGLQAVVDLRKDIDAGNYADIPDPNSAVFTLRALGLLANNMCASENTGTTNELLLARWYVNEVFLAIGDIRTASSKDSARKSYSSAIKAANSYLNMINRVITPKVGDKFELLKQ